MIGWILLAILLVVAGIIGFLIRGFKNPQIPHEKTPADMGLTFQELQIPTENNKQLHAWWIPADAEKAPLLILTHGWGQNQEIWLPVLKPLHDAGFHLLSFDARNHGHSESDGYANMLKFARDILHVLKFARQHWKDQVDWFGLIGFSIGGAATLYAAARAPEVKRVLTLGAFAHPAEIMKEGFRAKHIPQFPIVWLLFKVIEWKIGARLNDIAPVNNITRIQGDLVLVHGRNDRTVPVKNAFQLFERVKSQGARLYIIESCQHSNCIPTAEFQEVVVQFMKTGEIPVKTEPSTLSGSLHESA